jgi:hypothetical protein
MKHNHKGSFRSFVMGLAVAVLLVTGVEAGDWTQLSTGRNDLYYDCSFVDSNTGWLVGASDAGSKGVVLKTTDGGVSWMRQESDSLGSYTSIHRISAQEMWIAGKNGTLVHTTDGGANWRTISTGVTSTFSKITFRHATDGFAAGSGGVVVRTTDGGMTWSECANIRTVDSQAGEVNNLFCAGSDVYVSSFNMMIRSTDNGTSWTVVSELPANGTIQRTVDLGSRILCVTTDGSVFLSTDGYQTWTKQSSFGASARGMFFRDSLNGWVCGAKGSIFSTTDGGATWMKENTGVTDKILWSVFPVDSSTVYCVGTAGTVLRLNRTTTSVTEDSDSRTLPSTPSATTVSGDGYVSLALFRGEETVDVYSLDGAWVMGTSVQERLPMSGFAPGVYILRAGNRSMKVVKN